MKTLTLQTPCPCCQKAMTPSTLACTACQVKVEGPIATNEFASLPEEELHLLRVFVWAEGRVKDMEGPLGLSYPTIRSRLAGLKEKLRMDAPKAAPTKKDQVGDALDALEAGEIDFEQTLELLKKRKKGNKS
jgi:hypothetical protein